MTFSSDKIEKENIGSESQARKTRSPYKNPIVVHSLFLSLSKNDTKNPLLSILLILIYKTQAGLGIMKLRSRQDACFSQFKSHRSSLVF